MIQQRRHVCRSLTERKLPGWIRRCAVTAQVGSDHAKAGGRVFEDVVPVRTRTHEAVQPQQWLSVAGDFIIELNSVDVDDHARSPRPEYARHRGSRTVWFGW